MDFLTPMDVGMSEGRWADSPGPNWGTGPYRMWNPFIGCAGVERGPPQVFPEFQSLRCARPFPLSYTYTFPDIHTNTHTLTLSLPLANSLKRVTFVLQLPVKRGERCLWVNKVEVTDQVNLREQEFHFPRTFLWTPNTSLTARSDSSGTWWLMLWPQVKKSTLSDFNLIL